MNIKRTKLNLRIAAAAMVLLSAAVIAAGLLFPVTTVVQSNHKMPDSPRSATPPATTTADQQIDLTGLLDVNLRKPLVDAPLAGTPAVTINEDTPLGLRLSGTIMEPMHAYAIFITATGSTEIKCVGDRAGGAEVMAINPDSVSLQFNGKVMLLHAFKPSPLGGSGI